MLSKNAIIKGVIVLTALAVPAAFAQITDTQTATATVAAENTLTVETVGALAFSPTVAAAATDVDSLAYASNDGNTYRVTVAASVWTATLGNVANKYPVLSFVPGTATGGTKAAGGGLISNANVASAAADVVTGIKSSSGAVDVTYTVSIGQDVISGSYASTLTYSLVSP